MKFYLASGYSQRYNLRELANELEKRGHKVVSRWIEYDSRPERGTEKWDLFAKMIAIDNLSNLEECEAIIIDTDGIRADGNGGAHFEAGWGIAAARLMFVIGEKTNTFHWLEEFRQFNNYEEFLSALDENEYMENVIG